MIDMFLALNDVAAAKAQVNWPTDRNGLISPLPPSWLDAAGGSLTAMPITVWTSRPVYGTPQFNADGTPNYTTPPTVSPLYWLWVASAQRVARLEALAACKLVIDRDSQTVLFQTMTNGQINNASVFPVIAGTSYPFGRQI